MLIVYLCWKCSAGQFVSIVFRCPTLSVSLDIPPMKRRLGNLKVLLLVAIIFCLVDNKRIILRQCISTFLLGLSSPRALCIRVRMELSVRESTSPAVRFGVELRNLFIACPCCCNACVDWNHDLSAWVFRARSMIMTAVIDFRSVTCSAAHVAETVPAPSHSSIYV